ncbi:MAG: NfeD family protein [Pseudonocardia sp.]|nr:NfeD family protein [Pseudonocardia sp.]
MDPWVLWLILAMLLGAIEIATLTAAFGLLGGAALVASLVAAVGLPPVLQLLAFALAAAAGLVLGRPLAQRHLLAPRQDGFGIDALVGRSAETVTEVSGHGGRIRIDNDEWTARPYDDSLVIPAGSTVHVMEIRGATALVYPGE